MSRIMSRARRSVLQQKHQHDIWGKERKRNRQEIFTWNFKCKFITLNLQSDPLEIIQIFCGMWPVLICLPNALQSGSLIQRLNKQKCENEFTETQSACDDLMHYTIFSFQCIWQWENTFYLLLLWLANCVWCHTARARMRVKIARMIIKLKVGCLGLYFGYFWPPFTFYLFLKNLRRIGVPELCLQSTFTARTGLFVSINCSGLFYLSIISPWGMMTLSRSFS